MRNRPTSSCRRAFTVVEVMIVVLIMSIIGVISIGAVADFEAAQRGDRAAREALALFRFARSLAMTTGKNAKVRLVSGTSGATFSVYHKNYSTSDGYDYTAAYATNLTTTRTMVLDLNNSRELVGTAVSPTGTTDFEYNVLGSCTSTATLTFTYGGRSKSIVIAKVGDPTIP